MVGATSLTLATQLVLTALIKFPEFSGLGSMWLGDMEPSPATEEEVASSYNVHGRVMGLVPTS